jgi:regulatory protein
MQITAIKQQVKRAERYSIYVDEKYSYKLSESHLLEQGQVTGQELTKDELEKYKQLSVDDKLYNQVLGYLAIRPRSAWEIRTYLERKGSPTPLTDKLLNKLSDLRLIDDESFARSWVENRRLLKPTSRRRLRLELRQKHVSDEIIEAVLEEDETTDQTTLQDLITRKRKQTKYQDDTKLMQYLARQGFNYDDIKSALQEENDT